MDCLINLAAICLLDPSQVYVTATVHATVRDGNYQLMSWCGHDHGGWCRGKLSEIKLGAVAPINRTISLDYGLMHRSLLGTSHDQGVESFYFGFTWRPFN